MRVRKLAMSAILLIIAFPCFGQEKSVYQGIVQDKNHQAIAGSQVYAVMELDDSGQNVAVKATTTSDSDGSYKFDSIPKLQNGQSYYFVAYSKDNYLGWASVGGKKPANYSYPITAAKLISQDITVVDGNRKVVAGAKVEFDYRTDLKGRGGLIYTLPFSVINAVLGKYPAATDNNGRWTFTQLPEDMRLDIRVRKPGYVQVGAAGEPLFVFLSPAGSLTGRLVSAKGEGIPDASISIFLYGRMPVVVKTDSNGGFSTSEVLPGTYTLFKLGDNPDYVVPVVSNVSVEANKTTAVPDMVATPGLLTKARVVDAETKAPIDHADVFITPPGWPQGQGIKRYADVNGLIEFRSVPGRHNISISSSKPGIYTHSEQTVTLPPDGSGEVILTMSKESVAKATIVDTSGKAVAGARVLVNDILHNKALTTDAAGQFSNPLSPDLQNRGAGFRAGEVLIEVEEPSKKIGFVGAIKRDALLRGDARIVATPAKPFTVVVRDTAGKAVKDAEVKVYRWYADAGIPRFTAKSDPQGKLVLDNLYESGTYMFEATAAGYYTDKLVMGELVTIGGKTPKNSITLVLEPANRVQKGKVVDSSGKPVKGATVGTEAGTTATTDDKGEFTIGNLPDKDIRIGCAGKIAVSSKKTPYLVIRLAQ